MNRNDARKIAEVITPDQLKQMFDNAKAQIRDWTEVSCVNNGLTKGVAWNILAKDFHPDTNYTVLAKTNMIREFGKYLPDELKVQHWKRVKPSPMHQDPIF